jgi:hypothetical protein
LQTIDTPQEVHKFSTSKTLSFHNAQHCHHL